MDKKIYLWNELDLFYNNLSIDKVDNKLLEIANKFKCIEVIKSKDTISWMKSISNKENNLIALGTRPKKIFISTKSLKISRVRNITGKTISFIDDNTELWQNMINLKEISLCEDVLIEGETIKYICNKFSELGYSGILNIYIFCANKEREKEVLNNKYGFTLNISVYKYLKGKPIIESTLFCLYDLLFEKLGDVNYIDRTEIFQYFLSKNGEKFILEIKKLRGELENGQYNFY